MMPNEPTDPLERQLNVANRRPWVWLAVIALLMAVQIKWWWEPGDDATTYLAIARNLAHGHVARLDSPHLIAPPGYPLLIAPAFWLSGRPFLVISLIHWALAMALAGGLYLWFRRIAAPAAGLLTALVMVNVSLWDLYRVTLSELAFMAWLVWSVHCLQRVADSDRARTAAAWSAVATLVIVFGALTRHVTVFVVGGFALVMAIRALRGRVTWTRAVATSVSIGVPVFLAVLALVLWDKARALEVGSGSRSHLQYISAEKVPLLQHVVDGLRIRVGAMGRLMLPGMHKANPETGLWVHPTWLICAAVTGALLVGWWKLVRRNADILMLTAPVYVSFFVVVWTYSSGNRYLVPMLPVLVAALWGLLERVESGRLRILLVLVVLHALVAVGDWVRDLERRRWHARWPQLEALVEPMGGNPRHVAVRHIKKDLYLMLMFQMNHRAQLIDGPESIDASTQWLIMPAEERAPPGFVEQRAVGDLRLLSRGP
ncbi:MAG: ArnT family glycosyltransferase [Planctomycetota bacterium]|jgi:hypothetical protein